MGDRKSPILSPFRVFPRIPAGRLFPIFPGDEPVIPDLPTITFVLPTPITLAWIAAVPGLTFPDQLFPDPVSTAWNTVDPIILETQIATPNPFTMTWDVFIPNITVTNLLNGLIAFWKLEEASGTRFDEVGSNDLTDNNTVTQAVGRVGNAAQFVKTNGEFLSITDNPSLSTGNIDFTCSVWVFLDSDTNAIFMQKGLVFTGNDLEYLVHRGGGTTFFFSISSDGNNINKQVAASSFGNPSLNTWHHIVAWHDSVAETLNISINNGTVDSLDISGVSPVDRAGEFRLGGEPGGAGLHHDGRIDAVGFWKRVLNAAERAALFNSGSGLEHPFT